VLLRRPCTHAGCKACEKGEGHPTWYLSRKVGGKTRLTYLPNDKVPVARQGIQHYARLRALLEEIAELNAEGLKAKPGARHLRRARSAKRPH